MDYEKKYKEALERMRDFLKDWEDCGAVGTAMEKAKAVFSELAESEDEKILSDIIKDLVHPWNEYIPDRIEEEIKWLKNKFKSLKDTVQPHTKQEWSGEDEKISKAIIKRISGKSDSLSVDLSSAICWIENVKERVQPQSKQEWKQENTVNLTDFENAMMHIGNSFFGNNAGLDPNNTTIIKEQANILLELVSSKKWSEEDDKTLNEIFSVAARASLRKSTLFGKSYDYIKWQKWLKSLRPQNTWKPSLSQLNALGVVTKGNAPDDIEAIVSLYQDLKKLREE